MKDYREGNQTFMQIGYVKDIPIQMHLSKGPLIDHHYSERKIRIHVTKNEEWRMKGWVGCCIGTKSKVYLTNRGHLTNGPLAFINSQLLQIYVLVARVVHFSYSRHREIRDCEIYKVVCKHEDIHISMLAMLKLVPSFTSNIA